jgi:hypothetical protein
MADFDEKHPRQESRDIEVIPSAPAGRLQVTSLADS